MRAQQVATGEYLAFLNNDTRVDPGWLRALVSSILEDAERDVVCTGSKMLDWSGREIDFVGGVMNFHAFGYQLSYGLPVAAEPVDYTRKRDLLFACGGAMLIRADIFRESGGFDPDFFAFFEDVDLGWRLWLMGYRVTLTPTAITYHKGHGTASSIPDHRRLVLYERNSLYALYKNYSDEYLARILPAALMLMGERVLRLMDLSGVDFTEYELTNRAPARQTPEVVHPQAVSTMLAADEFIAHLPALAAKRAAVQALRRRSDAEIAAVFGQPLRVALINHPTDAGYARAHYRIMEGLGVAELFAAQPKHVLLISPDVLPVGGIPTSGVGLRAWALGQGLIGRGHQVQFAMPAAALKGREDLVPAAVRELAWTPESLQGLVDSLAPDVVVTVGWPNLTPLARAPMPVACDFTGPHLLERDYQGYRDNPTNAAEKLAAIDKADFFTCIGERQRLYFMPWLAQAGVRASEIDARLAVIPYSLSPDLPEHCWPEDWADAEVTFVYGGVFLPWQDPSVALTATAATLEEADRGRLRVFGGKHIFHAVETGIFEPLIARLGASPRVQVSGLMPVDELERVYTHAHVAVDVMRRNPERELAFASRTVHYLWCGLPVIHSRFSEVAALIEEYEAGWIVDPDDAAGIRALVAAILADPAEAARRGANAQRLVRERLTWDRTIDALDAFVRRPYLRESRGAWTRAQAEARAREAAPAPAASTAGAAPAPTWTPGPLTAVVRHTARARRRPLAQALARGRALVQPVLPGGRLRPVVVEGERRFALPELVAGHTHGQRFQAARAGLCGVDLLAGTFARINSGTVIFRLRSNPGSGVDLAAVEVPAVGLHDGRFFEFRFPPIADSADQWFYVIAEAPRAVPGDAITFWARLGGGGPPGRRYEDGLPAPGDLVYRPVYCE